MAQTRVAIQPLQQLARPSRCVRRLARGLPSFLEYYNLLLFLGFEKKLSTSHLLDALLITTLFLTRVWTDGVSNFASILHP